MIDDNNDGHNDNDENRDGSAARPAVVVDGFSVDLGAMILGREWSETLADLCRDGTVAITTDRALDPEYGWVLLSRTEVTNPEVFGSTGYVQVLRR